MKRVGSDLLRELGQVRRQKAKVLVVDNGYCFINKFVYQREVGKK